MKLMTISICVLMILAFFAPFQAEAQQKMITVTDGGQFGVSSAVRHAKILDSQIEDNSATDKGVRNRIKIIVMMLNKAGKVDDPGKLTEVYEIIPKIDDNKFSKEKDLLETTLLKVTSK